MGAEPGFYTQAVIPNDRSSAGEPAPRILLLAAKQWMSTARLAMALEGLGAVVALLGPPSHPARETGVLERFFRYDPMRPQRALERALREWPPDAVIPADEVVLDHLHALWQRQDAFAESVRPLLRRSLGNPEAHIAACSRSEFLRLAEQAGVAVPDAVPLDRLEDLRRAEETLGWPMVLKADASSGGEGVRMVHSMEQAQANWEGLHRMSLLRSLRFAVRGRQWFQVRRWFRGERHSVVAQRLVSGGERTAMAVAHEGRMLASATFDVVETGYAQGPSSVLRVVDDAEMHCAMQSMIAALGISGFCGFDFMVEPGSGRPLLIEMNSRPTQISHLPLGPGRDMVAAFLRGVAGHAATADRESATVNPLIAIFPQELARDHKSRWLQQAFHDVPWESPHMVEVALKRGAGNRVRREDFEAAARMRQRGRREG